MAETLQTLITQVARGAAEGAAALRATGVGLELDSYVVETRLGDGEAPETLVRIDFVVAGQPS